MDFIGLLASLTGAELNGEAGDSAWSVGVRMVSNWFQVAM